MFFVFLRGDLFYALPCVILFLCFTILLTLRLPRLGKRELAVVLFVRLFDLRLFGLSIASSSWCLGRATVCDSALPGLFSRACFIIANNTGLEFLVRCNSGLRNKS